jgi:hypothetical protein
VGSPPASYFGSSGFKYRPTYQPFYWVRHNVLLQLTVELHLYGVTGAASHLDIQKIKIIGFFF